MHFTLSAGTLTITPGALVKGYQLWHWDPDHLLEPYFLGFLARWHPHCSYGRMKWKWMQVEAFFCEPSLHGAQLGNRRPESKVSTHSLVPTKTVSPKLEPDRRTLWKLSPLAKPHPTGNPAVGLAQPNSETSLLLQQPLEWWLYRCAKGQGHNGC